MKSKIILICGPTCTGKTNLSIFLAKKLDAEIINADATYIYKEPSIATAKITNEEMKNIPHHMIDIISLNEDYSIYNYQKEARIILNNLINQNKNIIIIGGSGLYIKALLYDYELEEGQPFKIDLSSYTNKELKQIADKIDENNNIHENNRQRLERYISHNQATGKTIKNTENRNNKLYDFISIGLTSDRETLYEKINNRVETMFKNGLLEEATSLKQQNLKNFTKIIGYKELNEYLSGQISLEEAKDKIKQNTRHYAKRQLTWFNNQMKDITWFNVNYDNFNETCEEIYNHIEKNYQTR